MKTDERGGRAANAVSVKPMDLDSFAKRNPGNFIRFRDEAVKIGNFDG
jgi:hypothetical protein